MPKSTGATRAFAALLGLAAASAALLAGFVWWQDARLAQAVWLSCQSAADALQGALPLVGVALPLAAGVVIVVRGLGSALRQLAHTRRLLRRLRAHVLPLPDDLAELAADLGLHGRLVLVDDPAAYAFAAGLAQPSVWLSAGLLDVLDRAELAAVLRHERHHLRRRDPLRVLLARSVAEGLFFLPAAAALRDYYLQAKEQEADAASAAGHELAAALLKLLRRGSTLPAGLSLAPVNAAPTDQRIRTLLSGAPAPRLCDRAMGRRLAASVVVAAALLAVGVLSVSHAATVPSADKCGYTLPPAENLYATPATYTPYPLFPR